MDLQGALGGDGIGGEVRHAGAGAEDDHPSLLEVTDGPPWDVWLGHLSHRYRRLDAGIDPLLLEEVLQGKAVHDRTEDAHVVGARTVHAPLLQLGTAEEVATAHHDRHLHALADHGRDLPGQVLYHVRINADLAPAEDLTRELEYHPPSPQRTAE